MLELSSTLLPSLLMLLNINVLGHLDALIMEEIFLCGKLLYLTVKKLLVLFQNGVITL